MMTWFKTYMYEIVGGAAAIVFVAMLSVIGFQYVENAHLKVQLAGANATIAKDRGDYDLAYAKQSEANRDHEKELQDGFAKQASADAATILNLKSNAAALAAAGVSLRSQLASYTAAARARSLAASVAGNGPATAAALDLLSDLYGSSDSAEESLSIALDSSYARGKSCEAQFQMNQAPTPTVGAPGITDGAGTGSSPSSAPSQPPAPGG